MIWWGWWYDNDNVIDNNNSNSVVQSESHFCLKFLNNINHNSETWITAVSDNAPHIVKNFFGFWVSQDACYPKQP